jgi:hypothetical protein
MSDGSNDDLAPVSVRLGAVVPPEDPEDWTRPLTWVAAAGMLVGPLLTLAWFLAAPPVAGGGSDGSRGPLAYVVAVALSAGAAVTGATQRGRAWAFAATVGAGLFGALVMVVLGAVMAGERQVGTASPTLAHAFAAAVAGLAGAATGGLVAAAVASVRLRLVRLGLAALVGVLTAVAVLGVLPPPG